MRSGDTGTDRWQSAASSLRDRGLKSPVPSRPQSNSPMAPPQAKSGLKGMQSLLVYKVRRASVASVPKGRGAAHSSCVLFLGRGLRAAQGGLPQGPNPHQPLRAPAAASAYHPALRPGKEVPSLCAQLKGPPPTSHLPLHLPYFQLSLLQKAPPYSAAPEVPTLPFCASVFCRTGPCAPAGGSGWK